MLIGFCGPATQIYGLVDPDTHLIVYVGKSVLSLRVRLSGHEYKARSGRTNTPVGCWIRRLQLEGKRPEIILLETTNGRWQDSERAWIRKLRSEGACLLNVHVGGNGAHTRAALPSHLVPLLGKISDGLIADRAGLCRETITYHRNRAGIVRAPRDTSRVKGAFRKGQPAHNKIPLPASVVAQLGLISDRALSAQSGYARTSIRLKRLALGILPYPSTMARLCRVRPTC